MKHLRMICAIGTLCMLLAACTATGQPSVDEIVRHLQAAQQQTLHAVAEMNVTMPQQPAQSMVMEQWQQGPERMRVVYQDGPA